MRCSLVILYLICLEVVIAHSHPPRPLKRITHPVTLALEILPRQPPFFNDIILEKRFATLPQNSHVLQHSDTLRLTLLVFDEVVHLHLRSNDHLIHPSARVNYYRNGLNGQAILDHSEPLLREKFRVYWGEVIHIDHTTRCLREDVAGVIPKRSRHGSLGWARIMIHDQGDMRKGNPPIFEGTFSVDGIVHHVLTRENYLRNKQLLDPEIVFGEKDPDSALVVFRDSDVMTETEENSIRQRHNWDDLGIQAAKVRKGSSKCSHESLDFNVNPEKNAILRKSASTVWYDPLGFWDVPFAWNANTTVEKRDDVAGGSMGTDIGQTVGCPQDNKILYMGLAADCQYTAVYGSMENATMQIISNLNSVSKLYQSTFNISLGIVNLDIHDIVCPSVPDQTRPWNVDCSSNITLDDRLSLFSQWRGTLGDDGIGLWHLMSGCPTGNEVGVAWLGTLCQKGVSGEPPSVVSGTAVSTNGLTEWMVVAHEIGHNFGAIHDCQEGCGSSNSTTSCCPLNTDACDANGTFIMNPITASGQQAFSQCSIGNICSLMSPSTQNGINATCLQSANFARQTITLQMCGNGIVEAGEDCDPGPNSSSTCCDTSTCKFAANALCDPDSSPCCTSQCQFAPPTQICRPSMNAICDTAEMCSGNSSTCTANVFAKNGITCGPNGLVCANGYCTSESLQCQTLGNSMNLTKSCPQRDNTCFVSCQSPTNSDTCEQLQSFLVDGSPCGLGGACKAGSCEAGSLLDTAKAWYTQNLNIAIPISVGIGLVVLVILIGLFFAVRKCCLRRNRSEMGTERLQSNNLLNSVLHREAVPPRVSNFRPEFEVGSQKRNIPAFLKSGSSESFKRTPSLAPSIDFFESAKERPTARRKDSWDSASVYSTELTEVDPLPEAHHREISGLSKGMQSDWVDPSRPYNGQPY